MHNFREIKIWQRAIVLAETIYKIVNTFPLEEKFGLTSQSKRYSISMQVTFLKVQEEQQQSNLNIFGDFDGLVQ